MIAITATAMGDEIANIALLIGVAASGNSLMVATLLLLQLAPMVALSPLAGQILDRRDAGRVLAAASVVQAAVLGVMATWPTTPVLLVGTGAVSICAAVITPAVIVLMPVVAGTASPKRANALVEISRNVSTVAGPLIGGLLVAAVAVQGALLVDAIAVALAAVIVTIGRIRRPVDGSGEVWWKGATDGFRYLWQQRRLVALLPVVAITVSASSMVNVAIVFFVQGPLQSGSAVLGLVTAAWGTGALFGSTLLTRREWASPERATLLGATAMGLAILLYGTVAVVGVTIVAALMAGAANSYQNIAVRTSVQMRTPERLRGRAHAAAGASFNVFFLVGYALGGVLAGIAVQPTMIIAGAVTTTAASVGYIWYRSVERRYADDDSSERQSSGDVLR